MLRIACIAVSIKSKMAVRTTKSVSILEQIWFRSLRFFRYPPFFPNTLPANWSNERYSALNFSNHVQFYVDSYRVGLYFWKIQIFYHST